MWLARSDKGMVGNFLTTVEYLIKRGNVRKANDSSTVKTMLIDAEFELITALKERQYLDAHGHTSAFQRGGNTQTEAGATGDVANARQDKSQLSDYVESERQSIKQQITSRLSDLSAMQPVHSVESSGRGGRTNVDIANDLVAEFGGEAIIISRDGYGEIVLDHKRILKALNKYVHSDAEIAAFSSIPSVLKDGIEIGIHENHKGRGYGSTTFGAPISLNGEIVFVGATVKETDKNRYSVHRVLMTDGKGVVLADIKNDTARNGGSVLRQEAGTDTPVSGITIDMSQDAASVDPQNMETQTETVSDIRAIFNGKGEGHSDVMCSRSMTIEDYMELDFSKNKILQEDGTPYKVLYSGTQSAGHTVFDPAYGDDGLTTWLTNKMDVAQSYARESPSDPLAREYDPYIPTGRRKQVGVRAEYYDVAANDNDNVFCSCGHVQCWYHKSRVFKHRGACVISAVPPFFRLVLWGFAWYNELVLEDMP